jgi:chemosensory pili system protein ChpA (sensor histidine kinase/response regulator)
MIKSTSQIKKRFSEESQVFINDFQNRISELDSTLPNFSNQIDGVISTYELLQNSAIEANFYTPKSAFSEIIHHFEESISLLSYQHIDVDWITKGLLFEAINMMSQIIDEYCFDRSSNQDWIKLQNNLFNQLTEHFRLKSDQFPNQSLKELSDELNSIKTSEVETKESQDSVNIENEPFNLTDISEEFHLFDVDFETDNQVLSGNPAQGLNQLSNQNQQFEISDGFLLIQLDQQLDDHEESSSSSEFVQDLSDIFDMETSLEKFVNHSDNNYSVNNFFGDEDETEILGTSWDDKEISVEDDINNTLIEFSSLKSWGEMDADDALAIAQMEAGFEFSEGIDDSDCRINFALSGGDESLEDNENNFWEPLISPLISIENVINRSQSDLLMIEQLSSFNNIYSSEFDQKPILLDHIKNQDFSTSDIDTAIEMSPIYQNNTDKFKSAWLDVSLTSFPSENRLNADKKLAHALDFDGEDVDTQVNALVDTLVDASPSMDYDTISDIDSDLEVIDDQSHSLTYENGNNAVIRMPLHSLTKLGNLSEDLLLRNGNLDIYLYQIRKLAENAQQSLQTLQPNITDHVAIASLQNTLQNTFVEMVNMLEYAEQQTSVISHDVHHLRKNLGQVLRQPISSLLSRFPRILRDLSLQYGKQVELLVQGAEVAIERAIADVVVEPLDLLIRNAFEYGIESPRDRQRQGKLPQGKIEIIAIQTEENTVIKVCDDGRGVDNIADIEDNNAELRDLRKKLQEVSGTISVQSHRGKGTQYTIILPNTLSLVRVLLIEINQLCLAIPSKVILEVLPIAPVHNLSNGKLKNPEIQETLLWRDHQVPIVRLNSLLKLNCRTASSKPANAVPSYLVIQHENNLLALAVDGCWHDQDATFHQIEGDIKLADIFAGTVILGNDRAIALINPTELVNQIRQDPLNNFLNPPLKTSLNASVDDEIQPSYIFEPNPVNLNGLADFFDAGDSLDSNFLDLTEQLGRQSENYFKPENLESSGIFISDQGDSQTRPSHQPKVLIVESSVNIRRYLSMTLVKAGFLTEQVNNGQEAIAFLKESINSDSSSNLGIDIVITDLASPQMNGFKLLTNIRTDADLQNLPVVVLASHDNDNDRKLALDLGANAYFSKPYHEQELMTALQQMVI